MLSPGPAGPERLDAAVTPALVCFGFWLPRSAGVPDPAPVPVAGIDAAIRSHLARRGWVAAEPLRWAITGVDPIRGLHVEGIGVQDSRSNTQDR